MAVANPGIQISDPKAYQKKLSDLLGNRDPLTVLAETPDKLKEILRTSTAEKMRERPFPGKWTPLEVIGHLVDTEFTYGFRVRHIFCEVEPTLIGMDQEKWVERQRYNERDPAELVSIFAILRKANLAVWKLMTPADLRRVGRHAERGPETLELMLRMEAGHDLSHIDQIRRYLQSIG
jgi:hypothetical protein